MQAGERGAVKVGTTSREPRVRIRALQTASPEELHLRYLFDDAEIEAHLHEQLEPLRIRGEWFDPSVLEVLRVAHAPAAARAAVYRI